MNDEQAQKIGRLVRERALYLYSTALERGDFDAVESVLHQAEGDPALEQMILDVNQVYRDEYDTSTYEDAAAVVRRLLQEKLPSGLVSESQDGAIPPLTVGHVVARLQADSALRRQADQEISAVAQKLRQVDAPLPDNLSRRGVAQLFERFGLVVSERFQMLFRETAIFLSMGHKQGMARLAATRRQQRSHQAKSADEEKQS